MDALLLVVRNDEEYLGKFLAEVRKMQVRGLARDWLEFIEHHGNKR